MNRLKFNKILLRTLAPVLAALALASTARAAELPEELVPVGEAVGISVRTDGVLVSELSEFETAEGRSSPARDAGILPGDIILAVDGREISSAADLAAALEGRPETVTVRLSRDGEDMQTTLRPFVDGDGAYLGVWVRDRLSGIGTVTYYDPATGRYGALGHSIADSATGVTVPLREGEILPAKVTGVTRSAAGSPGMLGGTFESGKALGTVETNCSVGIFGTMSAPDCGQTLPVATAADVRPGPAVLISDVSGQRREYSVEITRLRTGCRDGRDMMLKVTDPDLLELTGGIVQGMSGSPIVQNGRLVGAVTHVLINDPRKGYGVFLETMLTEN